MKRSIVFLSALALLAATARAEDAPSASPPAAAPASPAKPAPPPTPEQAADAVLAAVAAKDDAALKVLAAKDGPDPWLVADELVRRGEFDVADAFARAAPRVDTEALPAYVASRRGTPDDAVRRATLAAANTSLGAGRFADALATLGAEEPAPVEDVVGVRLAMVRGLTLARLVRLETSAAALLTAGEAAEQFGWLARASRAFGESGMEAFRGSAFAAARDAWERGLSISERRGDKLGAARTLGNIGMVHSVLGEHADALTTYDRALTSLEALGDKAGAASVRASIALAHYALGNYARALSVNELALAAQEALGEKVGAAATLGNIGLVHERLGNWAEAMSAYGRALTQQEALRDHAGAAKTLSNIGNVQYALGDNEKALLTYERALLSLESLGDKAGAAQTLGNIGLVHSSLGNYAKALSTLERALTTQQGLGDKASAALTLSNIGSVHYAMQDNEKALSAKERALAILEALGERGRAAGTLADIGSIHFALGDNEKALSTYERVLVSLEALGDKSGAARTLGNLGLVQKRLGNHSQALWTLERALKGQEALGDGPGATITLTNIGGIYTALGDHAQALTTAHRALEATAALGDRAGMAGALCNLAVAQANSSDPKTALDTARRGVAASARLVEHLADAEGARVRESYDLAFEVGVEISTSLLDAASLSWFLEQGRAGALRAALGSREALEAATVPKAVGAGLLVARAEERRALAAYRKAGAGNDAAASRAARRALDAAQEKLVEAEARVDREARAAATLTMGAADELDVIRSRLRPDEALVLYGRGTTDYVALVVRQGGTRIVSLGATESINVATTELLEEVVDVSVEPLGGAAERSDGDAPTAASGVERVRRLIVAPLGLGKDVRRVLVSPTGLLGFVPFALLLPEREVAYVPSGTTLGLLQEDGSRRGDGVLALGDPEYERAGSETTRAVHRGGVPLRLARLGSSRAEVQAFGTVQLLGGDATESGLRAALTRAPRWRAVHLACHGLFDPERPLLSSLVVSADGEDDGFLTALEILRTRVPTDLVVMSACETGKGKVYRTEGIVGLTRAFMFAGSPRVICSLWKVDDAATSALMTKFYELWNPRAQPEDPERAKRVEGAPGPGLPTAEALRRAQAFVRSQEKWKHPYYWAAWVLWGLPS